MNKKIITLLLLSLLASMSFASDERNNGYLYTVYGQFVRDAYGHCVHTAYYDPDHGLDECGEGPSKEDASSGG